MRKIRLIASVSGAIAFGSVGALIAVINPSIAWWQIASIMIATLAASGVKSFVLDFLVAATGINSLEQDGRTPDAAGETSLLQRKEGSIE